MPSDIQNPLATPSRLILDQYNSWRNGGGGGFVTERPETFAGSSTPQDQLGDSDEPEVFYGRTDVGGRDSAT